LDIGRKKWCEVEEGCIMRSFITCTFIRVIKSERMRWTELGACVGEKRNEYKIDIRKPEGKRPRGRPTRRWEDNIKMDLRKTGWQGMEWIHLAQDSDEL
jgi:hypothetical protein